MKDLLNWREKIKGADAEIGVDAKADGTVTLSLQNLTVVTLMMGGAPVRAKIPIILLGDI